MSRALFASLGALLIVFPRRIVDAYEQLTQTGSEETTRKPWVVTVSRIEGGILLIASLLGGRAYLGMMQVIGAFGAMAASKPRRYLDWGTRMAYDQPETVEWEPRFVQLVRWLGITYVLLAIHAWWQHRQTKAQADSESVD